jgi:hypothetical protein
MEEKKEKTSNRKKHGGTFRDLDGKGRIVPIKFSPSATARTRADFT